jgi:hypothetical protein
MGLLAWDCLHGIAFTFAANLEPENVNEVTAPRMASMEKILANILVVIDYRRGNELCTYV